MAAPGHEFGEHGLQVAGVIAQSMAERAGIRPGDVVQKIGHVSVNSLASLRQALALIASSARTTIRFARDGEFCELEVDVCCWPKEDYDRATVEYGSVDVGDCLLRTITTIPNRVGPHPAVFFLQGIRKGTVDLALSPKAPLRGLVRSLSDRGYATVRLERRGVGDSDGGPFAEVDFVTEASDVAAALEALAPDPSIDHARITLFGHSTGGMIAPFVSRTNVASAIVVYGTSAARWFDCLIASTRNQATINGSDPNEATAPLETAFASIRAGGSDSLFGRSAVFHWQLENANLSNAWAEVQTPVLALHGEFDWVVSKRDAHQVLDTLEKDSSSNHAFSAARSVPGLDHAMTQHDNLEASVARYGAGEFGVSITSELDSWLQRCWRH